MSANVRVERREGEDNEALVDRFMREVAKGGVLAQVRKRRWFVSKSEQRRLAKKRGLAKQRQVDREKGNI